MARKPQSTIFHEQNNLALPDPARPSAGFKDEYGYEVGVDERVHPIIVEQIKSMRPKELKEYIAAAGLSFSGSSSCPRFMFFCTCPAPFGALDVRRDARGARKATHSPTSKGAAIRLRARRISFCSLSSTSRSRRKCEAGQTLRGSSRPALGST